MPGDYDHIKRFVADAIAARSRPDVPDFLRPSAFWSDVSSFAAHVRTLDDGELRHLRHHTWHLTADNYQSYYFGSDAARRAIEEEYEYLVRRLGVEKPMGEGADGLGFESRWGKLSRDLMRYLQVLLDLQEHDALPKEPSRTVLEIGGGYGGLAAVIARHDPAIAYVLLDLEETLFFEAVHLTNTFGRTAVVLCDGDRPMPALVPGRFYLVPQARPALLTGMQFDLAINQQSMQEMNQQQVEHYCGLLERSARLLYTSNLDHHNRSLRDGKNIVTDLNAFLGRRLGRTIWDSHRDDSLLTRAVRRMGPLDAAMRYGRMALSQSPAVAGLYRAVRRKPLGRQSDFTLRRMVIECRK